MSLLVSSRARPAAMWRGRCHHGSMVVCRTHTRTRHSSSTTFSSAEARAAASTTNPLVRAFRWYSNKLETHPLLTKGLTAGTIGAMGDVLCQRYVDKPEKERLMSLGKQDHDTSQTLWWWEVKRSARFLGVGMVVVGPWCHAWFGWLARTFPKLTFQSIATRVALDQFAFTPVILSTFISSIWQLEHVMGDAPSEVANQSILTRLKETLPHVIVANWMVWGPVQLINFRFVPQPMQVLFANMISLVWNAYLSFSTRAPLPLLQEEEQDILDHAPAPVVLVQRMTSKMEERLHPKKLQGREQG